jgi:uncharacterized protein YcfL
MIRIHATMKRSTKRSIHLLAAIIPALALLATVMGCHDNERPIPGRGEVYERPWLTVGSTALRHDTRIGDASSRRDESDILHVVVPVRNVTDKQLYVEYRITFLDAGGHEVNHLGPTTLAIPARQTREAVGNATSIQAREFRVELNYPRVN